jgi:magnesium-transporting ATPase (P-type)
MEDIDPKLASVFLLVCHASNNFNSEFVRTVEFITFVMLLVYIPYGQRYVRQYYGYQRREGQIVTDLGRIQYIFSDKTGTLTQNAIAIFLSTVWYLVHRSRSLCPGAEVDENDDTSSFQLLRQLPVDSRDPRQLQG